MPDRSIPSALSAARSTPEILEALARHEWRETHRADCPPGMVPTETALVEWLAECPGHARREAEDLAKVIPFSAHERILPWRWQAWPSADVLEGARAGLEFLRSVGSIVAHGALEILEDGVRPCLALATKEAAPIMVPAAHELWLSVPEARRPRHPLSPIVRAWQEWPAGEFIRQPSAAASRVYMNTGKTVTVH